GRLLSVTSRSNGKKKKKKSSSSYRIHQEIRALAAAMSGSEKPNAPADRKAAAAMSGSGKSDAPADRKAAMSGSGKPNAPADRKAAAAMSGSGKTEAEKMADQKELKLALFHISFFASAGSLFFLLSFLIPGISRRVQFQCWQTAAVAFLSAAVIMRRHPVVWSRVFRRWSGHRN
ncbi:unnamed protein product, partial [Urochloa humidicola]